jgi:NAD+ diphosphatase
VAKVRFEYCPSCGSRLTLRHIDGDDRLACESPGCHFVYWNNPVPVVAALVQVDDAYILARNAAWPDGVFSVLTGFLEEGETPESGVTREVVEELGLEVRHVQLIGHFSVREHNQLIIAFACHAEGSLKLGDEVSETRRVPCDELAGYDFGPLRLTQEIVARWLGMSSEETVTFFPEQHFRARVQSRFQELRSELQALVPAAQIEHVGSTAITGSLTKGDLDVQVRVTASEYPVAKERLCQLFDINLGGFSGNDAISFEDYSGEPHVGVHLTVVDGSADVQWRFRDLLLASESLRQEYDDLKRRFDGKSMAKYRDAKADFVERVLGAGRRARPNNEQ